MGLLVNLRGVLRKNVDQKKQKLTKAGFTKLQKNVRFDLVSKKQIFER
jgi:hypothetical protein